MAEKIKILTLSLPTGGTSGRRTTAGGRDGLTTGSGHGMSPSRRRGRLSTSTTPGTGDASFEVARWTSSDVLVNDDRVVLVVVRHLAGREIKIRPRRGF